jgi:GntR family transcriptional regulator of vanillate catabolism
MNQRALAVVRLREMILNGALAPGQRLVEAIIADQLGISRTPVRQALPVLAQEGLLISHVTRGYLVRGFSRAELLDAVDLRGTLEGAAARAIAERGAGKALIGALKACLEDGDRLFAKGELVPDDEEAYGAMNARLHGLIVEGSRRPILIETIARLHTIPFVAPRAIAFGQSNLARVSSLLNYAHLQHHAVVDAIEKGEGSRAAALMAEHAEPQKVSMNLIAQAAEEAERLRVSEQPNSHRA